jgi:hypothetical protein
LLVKAADTAAAEVVEVGAAALLRLAICVVWVAVTWVAVLLRMAVASVVTAAATAVVTVVAVVVSTFHMELK